MNEGERRPRAATDVAERLAALVRIPTVSAERDEATFDAFRAALEDLYPLLHRRLEREVIGRGALLYTWRGGDAAPTVLMAHQDVVPVTGQPWSRDPFGGEVADGAVHGRGALDDKGPLVVVLEAVESLLEEGFEPPGDVLLLLGDDEEVMGTGASQVADLLESRGVRPGLVLDEGGAVVEGALPGVRGRIAVVGVTEKGVAGFRLTARGDAGHAAVPPRTTAAGRLARAILRVERHPFPARTTPVLAAMLRALDDRLPTRLAPLLRTRAGAAALGPLLGRLGGPAGALARTTVAVTQLSGSPAPNVLASEASALLNVRILPGDTVETVHARLRRLVADGHVGVELVAGSDPPPVSPTDHAFDRIRHAIGVAHPDARVVPYTMIQASDARHLTRISGHVYRFMPFAISAAQLAAIHGADESVDVAELARGVEFHRALLTGDRAAEARPAPPQQGAADAAGASLG